jgi:hypothetical protein
MVMKSLRLRVVDGIYNKSRRVRENENFTRRMLQDRQFMEECVKKKLAFLKSIPNSVQYWTDRKKDLCALIRQLGKPTMILTMSANEIKRPHLLSTYSRRHPTQPTSFLKNVTLILSAVSNNVAKLHLHSLHRSVEEPG